MQIDLNAMAARVHVANAKWWRDLETGKPLVRNRGEMLMLMVSEVAECMEGERKGLMDDKLPHRLMAEVEMADVFIRALDYAAGYGYELTSASCPIAISVDMNRGEILMKIVNLIGNVYERERLSPPWRVGLALCEVIAAVCLYCEVFGYDLLGAYEEKLAFNAVRADHQDEARRAAGGKKW